MERAGLVLFIGVNILTNHSSHTSAQLSAHNYVNAALIERLFLEIRSPSYQTLITGFWTILKLTIQDHSPDFI